MGFGCFGWKKMKQKKIIKRLYWLGIFTLATSFIWLSLSGYHQLIQKQQIVEEDKTLIEPINVDLKSDVIPTIRERKDYSIEEVSQSLLEPTPTPTLASEPTPSVVPTSAPGEGVESTGSGQLEETQ